MSTKPKPTKASPTHPVTSAPQIRALASTVRQELIDALQALGQASVPELAQQLARPADALYYHVRALQRVGLLRQVGSRQQGRHVEAVYSTVAPEQVLKLSYKTGATAENAALKQLVGGMLRVSGRAFSAALGDADCVTEGPHRELWAGRIQGWLTPAALTRANSLLQELGELFAPGQRPADSRLFALQFLLSPDARAVPASSSPRPLRRSKP